MALIGRLGVKKNGRLQFAGFEKGQIPLDLSGLESSGPAQIVYSGLSAANAKAVEELAPIHTAQILTYLRLTGCKLGLLINFNVVHLKDGIKRVVNGL